VLENTAFENTVRGAVHRPYREADRGR